MDAGVQTIVVAFVTALGVGLVGWLTTRKVDQAKVTEILTSAGLGLVEQHRRDSDDARAQAQAAQAEAAAASIEARRLGILVAQLRSEVRVLRNLVVEAGLEHRLPPPTVNGSD